ncbi:MAG: glycosyltransferase [Terracidiphilus sp.]
MPKAVLHLLGTAQQEGRGIARIVSALAARIDPDKYRVHAWFLGPFGPLVEELQAAGAMARAINWFGGFQDPIGAYRFWRCLRKHDFAIVHQHSGSRAVRLMIRLSSDARKVVHIHGRISQPTSAQSVPVEARGADKVIAVSRAAALQLPTLRPIVVHAGVEVATESHSEFQAPRTTTVIGAACRLVPLKGLLDLVRAVAILRLELPDLQLEIAGSGPQREDLEKEIGRLHLANHVHLLGWQRNLRPIFRRWDILAMPSLEEGLPIAALEAMAEGLPVVATSVGGFPELIADGQTGFLVPPSNVGALTYSLRLLIFDSKLRQAMGAAGRLRVRENFSIHRMVAQIEAIYDSLAP